MTVQDAPRSPILVPMIVGSALFMQMLDSTVIATALPKMAESFGEDPVRLNLAITSYMLAVAIFIPVSGWVADRFGPRNVFRTAIALFTASSVLCALSNTLPELVGARMLQGMAGAMMVPVGRIVLLRSVPKSTYVQALSWVTIPALLGPVTGPPVGGFIVTYSSWHWIFLINVPIGILGFILVSLFIEEIGERETRPLDWQGFLMTGLGLAALIFGFETMGRGIIPSWAVTALVTGGAALLILYVFHARRAVFPLIDMSLARVPTFAAATFGGSLFRLGLGASPFLLALLLQVGFGLSPLEAGLLTFAGAAGALVMKFTAPPIIRRFGMRNVIAVNALIASAFFLAYTLFDAETPHLVILLVLLTGGFFRSLQMTALNALAYADIAPLQMSQANTLASMVQQLSLTLGVGLAALVIHWARVWNASPALTPEDIAPAIITVALLGAASLFFFLRLPRNAGEELNGRPLRARDKPAEIEQV